jgi:S-(hydroxymethyl)glutathione dehydrogenase/alcohol dehydrogenase
VKAAVLFGVERPFEMCDVTIDKPLPREVLIRVGASGLCHSDYHAVTGTTRFTPPAVLGHEAAGIVEAVGSEVTSVKAGDHVVSCLSIFCGRCNNCVSGRSYICSSRPSRGRDAPPRLALKGERLNPDGDRLAAFAEQMLVDESAVVRVDHALPLDRGALLGCGVMTGLGAVFNAARVTPGSKVAVVGCGGVGLNVIQGARIAGAALIIAIDLMAEKRALATKLGATHGVSGGPDAVAEVREITGGGADFTFEVVGLPQTIEQAVAMLARGGLMTMVGVAPRDAQISFPAQRWLLNAWRMQGALMGAGPFTRDIPQYASLYLQGRLDLDDLISERIPLEGINAGYDTMLRGDQARSVITFPDVMAEAARG